MNFKFTDQNKLFVIIKFGIFLAVSSCKQTYDPMGVTEKEIVPASIVSIQQGTSASQVLIELKIPDEPSFPYEITLSSASGADIPLKPGNSETMGNFVLKNYTVDALTADETYMAKLEYADSQSNKIITTRAFVNKSGTAWKKLLHAPISSGDYTGAAILSPLYNSQIGILRYLDETTWDVLKFFSGKWTVTESETPTPRHNAIAFPLGQSGGRENIFLGFGYINNEKLPTKKAYLSDMWWASNFSYFGVYEGIVFPQYSGIGNDIKFFLTYDQAFMIAENNSGAMRSMAITWDQKACAPLPEKSGKLAAFRIKETGYFINQNPGQAPRLYAYSIANNKWERKADFPGVKRLEGSAFSANEKGYFGLGVDMDNNGLRDIWEYDPVKNTWKYHSEYPGQGNRFLIALSDSTKSYIGWGYESRAINAAAVQQVGCTDFWEFNPR